MTRYRFTAGRRNGALIVLLALIALVLPLSGPAFATTSPAINVEPEIVNANQGDVVTLTATLQNPAPHRVNIDWEAETGSNDPQGEGSTPAGQQRLTPDRSCSIQPGAISCSVNYTVRNTSVQTSITGTPVGERWRAWVDTDANTSPDTSDFTDDSDGDEPPDESQDATPHPTGTGEPCESLLEPNDCTDVVLVTTGALEVGPDIQTVDAGTTVRLTARMFGPVQQVDGINVDFENETSGSANDPDRSNTPTTPDATCTIPQGLRECVHEYPTAGGSDQWRVWIDADKVQATAEADTGEGRYAGPSDCQQPEDTRGAPCQVTLRGQDNPTPGTGCRPGGRDPLTPDRSEPDCTDVVSVSTRSGPVARVDCDDSAGASNPDSERESNPSRPSDTRTGDPSTERYRCRTFNQFGSPTGPGIVVRGENENGVNDPDPVDGASYNDFDYTCTTTFDEDDLFAVDENTCYITVPQEERELGTAEICFWVGTGSEGQSLCADEPTGENQTADGQDTANDLADQVEKTWEDQSVLLLDCGPETDVNPAGTTHTVTCTATSPSGQPVSGVIVRGEAAGAGDADGGDNPFTPEFNCTTGPDGSCSYTPTSAAEGTTTYRSWIDDRKDEPAAPPRGDTDVDDTEGRDETVTPGRTSEPDNTDVVAKTWAPPPTTVTMTPESDTAPVGECNPYVITLTDSRGNPVAGATVDVEQRHQSADNQTQNDEPTVSFCEPPESAGPNPSNVDESRGDLRAGQGGENPDNPGTAGGETVKTTDQNGKVTIGIRIAPGNGSNGSGGVSITAWWETDENDDPGSAEPKDTSTKSWTPGGGEPGVPAGVNLQPTSSRNSTGDQQIYTATVSDANGDPVEGATVAWSEDGQGEFISQETTTDAAGQARATVTSDSEGTQTITVTASGCAEGATCSDSSTQTWVEESACPGHENDSRNQVVGTPGDDILDGTSGDDVICGLGGDDTITGGGGNDLILGGSGNDNASGGAGNDRINGGSGNDVLKGNAGKDTLNGEDGRDVLAGGGGNDRLNGGGGNDTLKGGGGNDDLSGGPGADTLIGGTGRDRCNGGSGRDRLRGCE